MRYPQFAQTLAGDSGIVSLMEDLGQALNINPDMLFLGGGNPASIPEFESLIAAELASIASDPQRVRKLVGVYQSPRGDEAFIDALVAYYRDEMGWPVTHRNIALSNGSQSAFFILLNSLAGDSEHAKICFPMMPEYLGYADQCIRRGAYYGVKPKIEDCGEAFFKYRVDFDALQLDTHTTAICVSRPNNPTGNVLSDDEVEQLRQLSLQRNIPLVVDCAYGLPFPGICYAPVQSVWQPGMVMVQSLSKLGLPGVRTGVVIADEAIIEDFVKINTVMSLANANLGPALALPMVQSGRLSAIREQILLPFYEPKKNFMLNCIAEHFAGLNYRIHRPEGGFFVWLWLPDLPVSCTELYRLCKAENLLIMPGEPFFFGLQQTWQHASQCVRLNYCASDPVIEQGVKTLARLIKKL